jgi:hypothetical protein
MTKDEMKDEEQDRRLNDIEKDIDEIKSVTHGSPVMGWNGIIHEHRELQENIKSLVEYAQYREKFSGTILKIVKISSLIGGLILTWVAVHNLFLQ